MDQNGNLTKDAHWWLENALAWVMTKNMVAVMAADEDTYAPSLRFHSDGTYTTSGRREDEGWRILYKAMLDGSVTTYVPGRKWRKVDRKELSNKRWCVPKDEEYVTLCSFATEFDPPSASDALKPLAVLAAELMNVFPESDGPLEVLSTELEPIPSPEKEPNKSYIRFTDAAFWVATKGGAEPIPMDSKEIWKGSFDSLLSKITTDVIPIYGRPNGKAPVKLIDGTELIGLPVSFLPNDKELYILISRGRAHIDCFGPKLSEIQWDNDFNDKIYGPDRKLLYSHLVLTSAKLLAEYPEFSERRVKTLAPGKQCREWLVSEMKASPDAMPPGKTRASYLDYAKATYGVGRDSFKLVWQEAIKATNSKWNRRGPKASKAT